MHRMHTRALALMAGLMFAFSAIGADSSRMTVSMVKKPKGAFYAFAYSRGKSVVMRKFIYKDLRVFEVIRDGKVLATVQTGDGGTSCSVGSTSEDVKVVLLGKGKNVSFNRIEVHKGDTVLEAYFFDAKLNLTPVSSDEFELLNNPKDVEPAG